VQISLINSQKDEAGLNIARQFDELIDQKRIAAHDRITPTADFQLVEVGERLIYQDGIDQSVDTDLIIFLSRHTSKHSLPLLTVHAPGNIGVADLGGKPNSIPPTSPTWMKAVFNNLLQYAPQKYKVTYEVTHHGPTELDTPSFFVEIGSTHSEWIDPAAGRAVAQSIFEAVPRDSIHLLGLGGNHYASRVTKIAKESRAAFGHIIHTRDLPLLDSRLITTLRDRSGAVAAYIDRNSVPNDSASRIEGLLTTINLSTIGERELVSIGDLRFETFIAIIHLAQEISSKSHPIVHHLTGEGDLSIVTVDANLLIEALRSNAKKVRKGIENLPLAHLTTTDGSILPKFITFERYRSKLINDLINLCVKIIIGYQKTSIDGDFLFIHKLQFDPAKARKLGIPMGPLYGMLSSGQSVEVDGRVITPAMVHTECTKILYIPGLERYV